MSICAEALDLIKEFEGLELERYFCSAGRATIGYGSTHWWDGGPIPEGAVLANEEEALKLMALELGPTEMKVRALARCANENQVGAMVSLAYNIGRSGFAASTLLRKHNAEDFEGAAREFPRWCNVGGVPNRGLKRRRLAERELYLKEISWDAENQRENQNQSREGDA